MAQINEQPPAAAADGRRAGAEPRLAMIAKKPEDRPASAAAVARAATALRRGDVAAAAAAVPAIAGGAGARRRRDHAHAAAGATAATTSLLPRRRWRRRRGRAREEEAQPVDLAAHRPHRAAAARARRHDLGALANQRADDPRRSTSAPPSATATQTPTPTPTPTADRADDRAGQRRRLHRPLGRRRAGEARRARHGRERRRGQRRQHARRQPALVYSVEPDRQRPARQRAHAHLLRGARDAVGPRGRTDRHRRSTVRRRRVDSSVSLAAAHVPVRHGPGRARTRCTVERTPADAAAAARRRRSATSRSRRPANGTVIVTLHRDVLRAAQLGRARPPRTSNVIAGPAQ